MKDIHERFINNLKVCRTASGISQAELSKRAGLKPRRIDAFEGGRGNPDLQEVAAICTALNVTIDQMLYFEAKIVVRFDDKRP